MGIALVTNKRVIMMNIFSIFLCLIFALACGRNKNQATQEENVQNEKKVGIGIHSECGRAKEIQGSNSLYNWTKAEIGNLQKIIISTESNTIDYSEARADSYLEDTSIYRYFPEGNKFFFKTTTKSLKLSFSDSIPLGTIEDDQTKKEYKVGILTYDDNSGFRAIFLCPKI